MYTKNEEVYTRAKEAGAEIECDPGCHRDVGCESGSIGNQQERIGGTDSSQQGFIGDGSPVTGGILRQLIDEYNNQLAYENERKQQIEAKIVQIDSRIQEFTSLLEQLETNNKT